MSKSFCKFRGLAELADRFAHGSITVRPRKHQITHPFRQMAAQFFAHSVLLRRRQTQHALEDIEPGVDRGGRGVVMVMTRRVRKLQAS